MQQSHPSNRGQPRLNPIRVPPLHNGNPGSRLPPPPVVVQQRPASPQMPPLMQRPMPPPAGPLPPHPPREIIPPQLHRPVAVSDNRPERQTEDDIREQLTDYIIFKFEKIEPYDEYDSEGEEVKSTWDNCIRRRLADVDKEDARREIRRLNREDAKKGRTFLEKQNSLGPKGQNQLAKAQRDLSSEERDDRFHTVLVQFDSSLKPVMDKHEKVSRHRSTTKRRIRHKKRYERTSITAYFKRCPRPNEVPSELARRIELGKQQMSPQNPQVMPRPPTGSRTSSQAGRMNRSGRFPSPSSPSASPLPQGAHMNHPRVTPMHQHNTAHGRSHTPIQVIQEHNNKDKHQNGGQSKGSGSSKYSGTVSNSEIDSESTLFTVPSRSSGSYKGKQHHGHKKRAPRYLEDPENFSVEARPARRHGLCEGQSYIITRSGTRIPVVQFSAPPREVAIPVGDVEQLQVDAYHVGRDDLMAEYRQRLAEAGNLETAARKYQPRHAPRPEIVLDRGRPRQIRHVTPSEVNRQVNDSFQRVQLKEGSRYHDELDDLVHREEQSRREAVALEEQECIIREFEEERAWERRRRESRPPLPRPFSPLSRRRAIAACGFERAYMR
ncbi:hypothetical protein VP1G_04260 [Cytospora mali]|uniref:Uncharacterized protein n=1 Tax=Cytospora mali TaxID=578113 RepID=A0A194UZA3_CYTMA|nr:hypothetical protein VP1G_04260 [Valsa mali var. pyri (nom. inval.)]